MTRRISTSALLLTMLTTVLAVVVGPAPAQAASYFGIKNAKSGLYLQPDDSFSAGTVIKQRPRQAGGWQEWVWVYDGSYRTIQSNLGFKNLGIDRGGTEPYRFAILANPSGAYNQDWTVTTYGNLIELRNRNSGLCLGINGASTASGATAIQAPCDGFLNQRWQIVY